MYIDVFNGDADGICALHQLRLASPVDSQLITGIKRDISLLSKVTAKPGDCVTVLDISLDKNRDALVSLLDLGVEVTYCDHHFSGEIPDYPNLKSNIDTRPDTCTSLLVNQVLNDQFLPWAVVAAFGDNLFESAIQAASPLNLSANQMDELKTLGICINYNGYGATLDDLFYHPAILYEKIKLYEDPFDFIQTDEAFAKLNQGYLQDLSLAAATSPVSNSQSGAVYILANEKWARRVSGIFGNDLAQSQQEKAHAVITPKGPEIFQVSVRAPLKTKKGADALCRKFDTGGGRQAAAGINDLPVSELEYFISTFQDHFANL